MIGHLSGAPGLDALRKAGALWARGTHAEPPRAPGDRFQPVPAEVQMTELRQLAAVAQPAPSAHRLDINDIRFGIEIEMMGVDSYLSHDKLEGLPSWWTHWRPRRWSLTDDGSLGSDGREAVSPPMRLKNGQGQAAIREAFRIMHASGGRATQQCGLHVHVDASVLGKKGLAVLMQMAMENEALLFRISQNGHPQHRGTLNIVGGEQHYFSKPLTRAISDPFTVLHADSPNEFRNAFYSAIPASNGYPRPVVPAVSSSRPFHPHRRDASRYFGINFNSYWYRGTVEFRLFDAVDDPEQAIANVEMVLGMVKTAAEGDYAFLQQNPLGNNRADVSREQYNYFLSKVAPDPELRRRLEQTFEQSGGHLVDDGAKKDGDLLRIVGLMQNGYRFKADGKPVASALEAQELLRASRRALYVVKPNGAPPTRVADERVLVDLVREAQQAAGG